MLNEGLDVMQSVLHVHLYLHVQKTMRLHFPFKKLKFAAE
jgi:hypothetical protein